MAAPPVLPVPKVDAGRIEEIVPSGVRRGDDASWAVWDDHDVAHRLGERIGLWQVDRLWAV